MVLTGTLRSSRGGATEAIKVLQLSETSCLVEASRPFELGEPVVLELSAAGESARASGVITALNELQLLFSVRLDDHSALDPALIDAAREVGEPAGD